MWQLVSVRSAAIDNLGVREREAVTHGIGS
jgi:hypothetical protein